MLIWGWVKSGYALFSKVSLDTVLGVYCSLLFCSSFFKLELPVPLVVGILVGTWGVYSVDRLLDNLQFDDTQFSFRHLFYDQQKKWLLICLGLADLILVGVFFMVDMKFRVLGGCLGVAFFVHHLFLRFKWYGFFKPVVTSLIYASAVFGPYFIIGEISLERVAIYSGFTVLCFLNLVLGEVSEYDARRRSSRASLAGVMSLQSLIYVFGGLCICLCLFFFWMLGMMFELMPIIVLVGMLMLSMLLFLNCRRLGARPGLFYGLKEAIFFFPILGVLG